MSRFWSPVVGKLHPYVPGEQPADLKLIKLNTNENPYGPSPRSIEAAQHELGERLRLYPNAESDGLRAAIAARFGLTPAHVFLGNGSDEVLAHAFHALFQHGSPLLFPDVTYSFYPTYCELYGIPYRTLPVGADFSIDPSAYRGQGEHAGIIFANPNAPTSRALGLEDVERLVQASPRVVLVDEAYVDFGAASAIPLVERHENLLVVQTFSKSRSLAGLRVGFAVGQPHLIEALVRVKNSFNSYPLDRVAQAAALAAWEDQAWFEHTRHKVIASREKLTRGLLARGFEVLPSATNFVFVRHPARDAEQLAIALRAQSVLVRHFKKPRIDQYLRITIGRDDQCEALLSALEKIG
ncbi:MAG TPA: histidinol-phosphate transaminase [Polyangiales bacterium]|nr:histidinol-phosphate transaminase [Polyangiales bacterium]